MRATAPSLIEASSPVAEIRMERRRFSNTFDETPRSVPLLTGCFPGHHDIMGNIWFDRRTLEIRDYIHAGSYRSVNRHFDRRTIYEILGDRFSVNIQCHTRRGVPHNDHHVWS